MKNIVVRLTILSVLSFIFIFAVQTNGIGSTVEAVGDLSVDFGVTHRGNPIFNIVDMKPGDVETKSILVRNDAPSKRMVGVRGIKTDQTASLSDAFIVTISENGIDLYGGRAGNKSLTQFFVDSAGLNGIPLSNLHSNKSTQYTFTITFASSSGNEFQSKRVAFDLQIGMVIDVPDSCNNINLKGPPIFGTKRNDNLIGTSNNDLIIGFEGSDIINGGGGSDCIIGNEGNDLINGGNGDDILIGGEDNDILRGGRGFDEVRGGIGKDICEGETKFSCEL